MEIKTFSHVGEGMARVYETPGWIVGIKNWKPANDITGIDCLERHNITDELFVLLDGRCVLLFAEQKNDGCLKMGAVEMQPMQVYCIPATLWHNTVTQKDTKLVLIENAGTDMSNSDILTLDAAQTAEARELAR